MSKTALIVVDVQNDFVSGSLPVPGAEAVAVRLGEFLRGRDDDDWKYDYIVATQDYHIDPHGHFSDEPNYSETWPVHCTAGEHGAELHPAVKDFAFNAQFRKGHYKAAYSGFEGSTDTPGKTIGLADWLNERGVTEVDVVGIATDYCVKATALDAVKEGFQTKVIMPFCAAVANDSLAVALSEFQDAGVGIE